MPANQPNQSAALKIGASHSPVLSTQCVSPSLTDGTKSQTTASPSTRSLLEAKSASIPGFLPLTAQLESVSAGEMTLNSQTSTNLPTSSKPTVLQSEIKVVPRIPTLPQGPSVAAVTQLNVAGDGRMGFAPDPPHLATSDTLVSHVEVQNTLQRPVEVENDSAALAKRPRYLHGMAWSLEESSFSPTAKSSVYAIPLPAPPESEFSSLASQTLLSHPHLFPIVTPINIPAFEELLAEHPNPAFVRSICDGLRSGFWPCASTEKDGYPLTWDNSHRPISDEEHKAFIQEQVDEEVRLSRFSPPFGPDLLPGMYSCPIHVVPKPNSTKFRLVVDHSAGTYSLNSMVDISLASHIKLDGMRSLGLSLLQFRRQHGDVPLVMFKSDVSQAYRRLPMHPLWQMKQIITVGPSRYVDRCNNFGGRGSALIWVSFMSLVLWGALVICLIDHLKCYMDDTFSFELEGNMLFYEPYSIFLPRKQALLLSLWDRLGIPHESAKQVYGRRLTIIGFEVDPNAMTISLPLHKKTEILSLIRAFAVPRQRHSLRDFLQLAGAANWVFNVFPLLKPGLSALYAKIRGKSKPLAQLYVNTNVAHELNWMAAHIDRLPGVLLVRSLDWDPDTAEEVITFYTDASSLGLAYWSPDSEFGFQSRLPTDLPSETIFFAEALAVCSAIHSLLSGSYTPRPPRRVAVYTDNTNSVDIFNSLRASPPYNSILMSAVDVLLQLHIDLRVFHVSGADNQVADALSRFNNDAARRFAPGLIIASFTPPRDALGASTK